MSFMSLIPGTQARAKKKFASSMNKIQGSHEVLLEIEWPDGSLSYEPADWIEEFSGYQGANTGLVYFAKGQGRRTKRAWGGAAIVQVFALNAGVISTESAIIAQRRDDEEYMIEVDGDDYKRIHHDGEQYWVPRDYNPESDSLLGRARGDTDDGPSVEDVALDADELDVNDKTLDTAPPNAKIATDGGEPTLDFEYAGECYSLREASDYDPNPINAVDVKALIDYVRASEYDRDDVLMYAALAFFLGAGLIIFTFVLLWLLGQFGGSGSAEIGVGVSTLLPLLGGVGA